MDKFKNDNTKPNEKFKPSNKYERMHKAYLRMLTRVKFKIKVHKKAVAYLVRNYKVIRLPEFNSKSMSNKTKRKLSSKATRSMLTWSHFQFRELLKAKVQLYQNCHLVICDEPYTSKICGKCGFIHKKLGSSELFVCPVCDYRAGRDINGARNILLRYLTLHPEICIS